MSATSQAVAAQPPLQVKPGTDGTYDLVLHGPVTVATVPALWREAEAALTANPARQWRIQAAAIDRLDGAGMALLLRLRCRSCRTMPVEIVGLQPDYERLLDRFDPSTYRGLEPVAPKPQSLPQQVGNASFQLWEDLRLQVSFIGELSAALFRALLRPSTIRARDLWLAAERAGADALPIVALISALVGLVLAFQAAMAMRLYGAEIYVANLVTIAVLRELGPLMTAIILAGRSGGAFAAELGTMKVNDEIAALTTLGLNPVPFLAVPRVLGLLLMTPFLVLFADIVGILGGSLMFLTLDYPISSYFNQALGAAELKHLLSGLVKSVAFGLTIAGVGCLRGFETLRGPSAVGMSTTRAVVTAILLIVIIDAVFGTLFYFIGF